MFDKLSRPGDLFRKLYALAVDRAAVVDCQWLTELEKEAKDLQAENKDLQAELEQLHSVIKQSRDAIPPPLKHLQIRVVGGYVPDFISSGDRAVGNLNSVLATAGQNLRNFTRVLDWGSGCGRIIRALHYAYPSKELYGTDIDPEAIKWCQHNYSTIATFDINPHMPPMKYRGGFFDFIYSVSVLTHLPENMQFAWLDELKRITKPGGYLILSVHGEAHHSTYPDHVQAALRDQGFSYFEVGVTDGLPGFYQNSAHTQGYIRREWSRYFDVVDILPMAIENHQDAVLLRAR